MLATAVAETGTVEIDADTAELLPAGTTTVAGTVATALSLVRLTVVPPVGALPVR
jgi:hypothetical protein